MGRAAVRAAIRDYIEAASVPYLGTVYPARPTILDEDAYAQNMAGQAVVASLSGSSCVIVVNVTEDHRQRQDATGRAAADDTNKHTVVLELFFACPNGDAIAAQSDYDAVADGLVEAIRANPTPGGSAVTWSAGEFAAGVEHRQGMPETSADGLTILIVGEVRFEAWEWIAGTS